MWDKFWSQSSVWGDIDQIIVHIELFSWSSDAGGATPSDDGDIQRLYVEKSFLFRNEWKEQMGARAQLAKVIGTTENRDAGAAGLL